MLVTENNVRSGRLQPQQHAAISLPHSLFEMIGDRTDVGVFFVLYDRPTLFPVDGRRNNSDVPRQTDVGTRVLAATVGPGLNFQNLADPVVIVLRLVINDDRVRQYTELNQL